MIWNNDRPTDQRTCDGNPSKISFHRNAFLVSALRGISEFAILFSQEFGDDVFLFTSFLPLSHGWAFLICCYVIAKI